MMNKTILFLVNHDIVIYNFRKELVEELLKKGFKVIISSPYGQKIDYFIDIGCQFIETKINRHGLNIIEDLKLIKFYKKIIQQNKPIAVLTYTIKPNIYGGIACRSKRVDQIANITGLGTAVEYKSLLQKITVHLYKYAFSKVTKVYFQNEENMKFFKKNKIAESKHTLIPGSGVNLNEFKLLPYPNDNKVHIAFISRVMREKGIDLFLDAAEHIKKKYDNVFFHVCGFCEDDYSKKLLKYEVKNIIKYHGMITDISNFLLNTHLIVHPSFYPEGMSNVLLEASSSGRPVITTDRSGCREIVDHMETGLIVPERNLNELILAIKRFLEFDYNTKKNMGLKARTKVENSFDRRIVINSYIDTINQII